MKLLKKILVALLLVTTLTACGSKDDSAGDNGSSSNSDVVIIATDTDLSSMDHHIATDGTSFVAQTLVFAGLTELNENNEPIPCVAESWDISEDGRVYTFHLVESNWSNGTPVTANDFVFAWQRLANADTASEYAFILETIKLENAAAVAAGEKDVSELGVKALDDHTLEVTLEDPIDFVLGLMAFPTFFPLNQEFYEAQGDQYSLSVDNMIYNGPFVMESWTAGNSYSFVKNDNYFAADKYSQNKIEFKFVQDTQSAMLEYQLGNIDVVTLSGEMVDAYKGTEGFTNRLQGYLWYLSINHNVDFMQNDNLRKAISLAIDREVIAESVLKDGSIAAEGLIPVKLATGPDGIEYREAVGKLVEYNPESAAEYYALAVQELGADVNVELLFEDTEASKAVAEYIQNNLETNLPGITVTLNSKPKKTRLEMMNNQDYQIALTRWGPDYADPQTYLDLFISTNVSNNSGRYKNADYDAAVLEATLGASASDSQARWELLKQAENIIVKESNGVVPVYQAGGALMINPNVSGIEFHSAGVDSYRNILKK